MAILEDWVGAEWAGRWGTPFKVWKMCWDVGGIRANPKLMLWAISKYRVKGCLFCILFCILGWPLRGRWDKMPFAHEQAVNSQCWSSQSLVLQAQHEQMSVRNLGSEISPNDQVPKVKGQSWVDQSALPVSRHQSAALISGQLFYVSHKKPEQEHKWIMTNLLPPLKNPQFNTGCVSWCCVDNLKAFFLSCQYVFVFIEHIIKIYSQQQKSIVAVCRQEAICLG